MKNKVMAVLAGLLVLVTLAACDPGDLRGVLCNDRSNGNACISVDPASTGYGGFQK